MKKIWLVTRREYLSRVKKKSFIIMTLLGPLLIALFYGAIFWVISNESKKDKERFIEIIDESGVIKGNLKNTDYLLFTNTDEKIDDARANLDSSSFYGILYFPPSFTLERPVGIQLFTKEQSSIAAQERLENSIEKELKAQRMAQAGLSKGKIDSLNVHVDMNVLVNNGGESKKSETGLLTAIGFALTFLMYMFVFIYGVQVMRGVMEEKTNRIVEVVISTVRPFQLMMGKIFGIAMVGLTQFLVWAILGGGLVFVLTLVLGTQIEGASQMQGMQGGMQPDSAEMAERFAEVGSSISLGLVIKYLMIFLFYFIFGYLMYSSLFAAVGSAVDNETDTQQFMLPITMPIVFSFVVSVSSITNDPHSSLAWWMSIIPLTSPVTMMARLPFIEGHEWDLVLSMVLLILGFVGFTWLAGRIYRTGILMYGKKVSYKEIIKWIRYKG
jgi:ABC-2 type transport system permease protein